MKLVRFQRIASIAAALAVAAFFSAVTWIAWQNRGLKIQPLIAAWHDAAPAKGKLDAVADKAGKLVDTATDALPAKGKLDQVADASTKLLGATTQGITTTATNINRPCKGPEGPDACGTLATLAKAANKAGDAVVTTQIDERKATGQVIAAMDAFKDAAGSIEDGSDSLNALLKSKAFKETIANGQSITASWASISSDAATQIHTWTHPSKKKLTFWTATEAAGDYVRHFMPSVF